MELRDDLKEASAPEPSWTWPAPRLRDLAEAREMVEARIRRRRLIVLAALAAVVACFLAMVVAVRATHPRDEADFLLSARTGGSVNSLSDADLVSEGDFACRWLSAQDRAWWNHGPWYDREPLLERYLEQTRPVLIGQWGLPQQWPETRGAVADAAWSQLCGGTWYWHRPHGPSLRGGGRGDGGD